jgi:hypothetical protein
MSDFCGHAVGGASMDVLIQAIIELFKLLFGASEPPAKVGPRQRPDHDRGPYDYGDGSERRPTLAEMLADAQRELEGQRPQTQRPQTRPKPQTQTSTPTQTSVPKPKAAPQQPSRPQPAAATYTQAAQPVRSTPQPVAVKPAAAPQPIAPQLAATQLRTTFRKGTAQEQMHGFRSANQNTISVDKPRGLNRYIKALRECKGANLVSVAAQTYIGQEIFGLPRSRKPFRPARSL